MTFACFEASSSFQIPQPHHPVRSGRKHMGSRGCEADSPQSLTTSTCFHDAQTFSFRQIPDMHLVLVVAGYAKASVRVHAYTQDTCRVFREFTLGFARCQIPETQPTVSSRRQQKASLLLDAKRTCAGQINF